MNRIPDAPTKGYLKKSKTLDELIVEHGGSARDALNVTLAKLEWAEWEIAQLKSAQQMLAPNLRQAVANPSNDDVAPSG